MVYRPEPPPMPKPPKARTINESRPEEDKMKVKFVEKHPILSALLIGGAIGFGGLVLQSDPLEPVEMTKYRIVYAKSTDKTQEVMASGRLWGTSFGRCARNGKDDWAWYGEELREGFFFDDWVTMDLCAVESEDVARRWVEKNLKRRLEQTRTKGIVYQAFISKEDAVTFEKVKNDE